MRWLDEQRNVILLLLAALILLGGALFLYRQAALPHAKEITISPPAATIEVDVEGSVNNPGVYELAAGSLVQNAIAAAGGFAPEADPMSVSQSLRLADGDTVHVYNTDESPQRININTADVWLLEALPGIGEKLAQDIVKHRTDKGFFRSVDDLTLVKGISPSLVDQIRDKATAQ